MTPATSLILGIIPFLIMNGNAVPTVDPTDYYCFRNHTPIGRYGPCSNKQANPADPNGDNVFLNPEDCCNLAGDGGGYTELMSGKRCSACAALNQEQPNDVVELDGVSEWSPWDPWSECSVTCGEGERTRRRTCLNPDPQNVDVNCVGTSMKTRACITESCTVDGNWGEWTNYGDCSATCGDSATHTRTRTCNNPAPRDGGKPCEGDDRQNTNCRLDGCPVHGAWSSWGTWSDCSVTCGDGQKLRGRTCNNPAPANGGLDCLPVGENVEFLSCTLKPCAINGGWSKWSAWDDSCSAEECNEEGLQIRIRFCSSPRPQHGGRNCRGSIHESQKCINTEACPVHGGWGEWGAYGECIETCGDYSYRERHRQCDNPAPRDGKADLGKWCQGRRVTFTDCPGLPPCPTEAPASGDCADDEDADCEFSGAGSGAEPPHPCSAFEDSYYNALCLQGEIDPPDVPGNEGGPAPEPDNNHFDYSEYSAYMTYLKNKSSQKAYQQAIPLRNQPMKVDLLLTLAACLRIVIPTSHVNKVQ